MNDTERTVVVGIAGPTCSGKSTLADAIKRHSPDDVLVLSQDDYYRDLSGLDPSEIGRINFDRPDAVDMPLLARQVRALHMGFSIKKPIYSRQHHQRMGTHEVHPTRVVVVEGIFVLSWPDIVLELDLKLFLDAHRDTIWKRRLRRDAAFGRTKREISGRFDEMTWPGQQRHVEPCRQLADEVVGNPFDGDLLAAEIYDRARKIHERLIPYSVMASEKDT